MYRHLGRRRYFADRSTRRPRLSNRFQEVDKNWITTLSYRREMEIWNIFICAVGEENPLTSTSSAAESCLVLTHSQSSWLNFPRESARCSKACLWTGHRTNFPGDIKGAWWNLIGFPLIEPLLPARPGIASHHSEASRWKPEIVFLSQDKQTHKARNPGQTFSHFPQQRFWELLRKTVEGFGRWTCFNVRDFLLLDPRRVSSNVHVFPHLHPVTTSCYSSVDIFTVSLETRMWSSHIPFNSVSLELPKK